MALLKGGAQDDLTLKYLLEKNKPEIDLSEITDAIDNINDEIGDTPLPTTAQTITGAIDELNTDISNVNKDKVLYLTDVPCSATTGNFVSYSNAQITANHVVAECVFASPSAITTDVTWTTSAGAIVLNGTCSAATTCNIVLVKKDN